MASEVPEETTGIRRHYERGTTKGRLELRMHPSSAIISAEVMSSSQNGFRIRYRETSLLNTGAMVQVSYPWGKVNAVIVWCHRTGEWTEAGFELLHNDSDAVP
jgi:hypothetical protein